MGSTTNLNWLAGFLNHQQYDFFRTILRLKVGKFVVLFFLKKTMGCNQPGGKNNSCVQFNWIISPNFREFHINHTKHKKCLWGRSLGGYNLQ